MQSMLRALRYMIDGKTIHSRQPVVGPHTKTKPFVRRQPNERVRPTTGVISG
jgi:hypothetical protein